MSERAATTEAAILCAESLPVCVGTNLLGRCCIRQNAEVLPKGAMSRDLKFRQESGNSTKSFTQLLA
jgi:hypothetical protein